MLCRIVDYILKFFPCYFLARDTFEANTEFEGLSLQELIDPSMRNWLHHVQHILPQGRCVWFNPFEKPEDDFEDEDLDEEEEENSDEPRPEVGPPLLSSVAEDERKLQFFGFLLRYL